MGFQKLFKKYFVKREEKKKTPLKVIISPDTEGYIFMTSKGKTIGLFMWSYSFSLRRLKMNFKKLYIKHPNMEKYFEIKLRDLRKIIFFSWLDFKLVNEKTGEYIYRIKIDNVPPDGDNFNLRSWL